jgi:hypothetical protein
VSAGGVCWHTDDHLSFLPPLGSVGTTRQAASCQMLIWSIWQLADGIELFLGIAGLEQTC